MDKGSKRYRQLGILEFSTLKRKKNSDSEERNSMESKLESPVNELCASAAEKRNECSKSDNLSSKKDETPKSESKTPSSSKRERITQLSEAISAVNSMSSPGSFNNSDELFSNAFESENEQVSTSQSFTGRATLLSDSSSEDEINSKPTNSRSSKPSNDLLFKEILDSDTNSDSDTNNLSNNSDVFESEDTSNLNRIPGCCMPLPNLIPSEDHTILFSPYVRPGEAPRPSPRGYRDKWDSEYIRMPCSPMSKYPVEDQYGEKQICERWNLICESLQSDIQSSAQLERAILRYNGQYAGKWNFTGLHTFIRRMSEKQRCYFFDILLPKMIEVVLDLPNICTQPIPLLKRHQDHKLTMSQKQIGCLMMNAFFCTFPRRNASGRTRFNSKPEYSSYPDINFSRLFAGSKYGTNQRSAEKLKCLINYFSRITELEPTGVVTFHRQYLRNLPNWGASDFNVRDVIIRADGLIENEGYGMLQVDFANKFIGGGVLGRGCVQEEIRFLICPELIISRLFTECFGITEALIVTGVEQYNKYSGYADDFVFQGDFKDQRPRDSWGRRCTQLVAIDAICFSDSDQQYKIAPVRRELNKALAGFHDNEAPVHLSAVATGNWGCGAFNGDPRLKFIIQLMAASHTGRSMMYFTFGDKKLQEDLQEMYNFINEKGLTVGDMWKLLAEYGTMTSQFKKDFCPTLYDYIVCVVSKDEEESSQESLTGMIADVMFNESNANCKSMETENLNDPG